MDEARTADTALLGHEAGVELRPLTVADYYRMGETGIIGPDERVELIGGEIVRMAPIGAEHAGATLALDAVLQALVGERALVSVQLPVALGNYSVPQPDLTLLAPPLAKYRKVLPVAADVLLVVELSLSTLRFDRTVKRALYARHGIGEYWVADLAAGVVEVCREPRGDGYTAVTRHARGAVLEPLGLPGVRVGVTDIVG